ncbi:hypothetical protein ACS127_07990 [Amphibacillus sp. Q70]|uniref:hypothetical protein n=1 Tax=Amphibacillus sp. Q70 TaxID=3453416 RepID=UPI003F866826
MKRAHGVMNHITVLFIERKGIDENEEKILRKATTPKNLGNCLQLEEVDCISLKLTVFSLT